MPPRTNSRTTARKSRQMEFSAFMAAARWPRQRPNACTVHIENGHEIRDAVCGRRTRERRHLNQVTRADHFEPNHSPAAAGVGPSLGLGLHCQSERVGFIGYIRYALSLTDRKHETLSSIVSVSDRPPDRAGAPTTVHRPPSSEGRVGPRTSHAGLVTLTPWIVYRSTSL